MAIHHLRPTTYFDNLRPFTQRCLLHRLLHRHHIPLQRFRLWRRPHIHYHHTLYAITYYANHLGTATPTTRPFRSPRHSSHQHTLECFHQPSNGTTKLIPTSATPSNPPPDAPLPRANRPRQPKVNPPTTSNPRHTAVKAAPKVRPDRTTEKSRRTQPPSTTPSTPAAPPPSATPNTSPQPTQADFAAIATTTQQLHESVRLLHAQQQHFMVDTFNALNQCRLEEQLLAAPHPSASTPAPPPNANPPTNSQPTPTIPTTGTTAEPIPPSSAPPRTPQPRAPISISPTPQRKRSRPRSRDSRSRSRRPRREARYGSAPHHKRPRSPLPRHRSSTANPKHRRTPSPQRRRSPPRHRSNPRYRPTTSYRSPPNTVYRRRDDHRRSRTPTRHPRTSDVVLTPAPRPTDPEFIPSPDPDDTWGNWNNDRNPPAPTRTNRPTSPRNPPQATPPEAPLGATTSRMPTGDSENSEVDDAPISIIDFESNDIDLHEMQAAANDPARVRCVTELGASHTITLRHHLEGESKTHFKQFVDEMFNQLAKPYTTSNGDTVFIKASPAVVNNIARAFAQACRLNITLAQGTQGFYVEQENLLTITVPTGLPEKPIYKGEHSATYMIYHKTGWDTVPKILVEDCIRPASWSTDEQRHPTQYPCYGFFGMSAKVGDHRKLVSYAVKQCTSQLYKIGKGQMPSGLLAICRSPKCIRTQSGGNDQLQRLCKLHGISRGKDGASAMNSSGATVAFVASTHTLYDELITRVPQNPRSAAASVAGDNPEGTNPDPPAPLPSSTSHTLPNSHPDPSPHADPEHPPSHRRSHYDNQRHHHRSWEDSTWRNHSWTDSSSHGRRQHSAYGEGRPRDQHREAGSGHRHSHDTSSRTRW